MFEDGEDRTRPGRRSVSGFLGVFALLLLFGLALAFSAPRTSQLATTAARSETEGNDAGAVRGPETTGEIAKQEADKAGSDGPEDKNPANASAEEPAEKEPETEDGGDAAKPESTRADASGSVSTETERAAGREGSDASTEQPQEKLRKEEQKESRVSDEVEEPEPPVPGDKTMSLSIPRLAAVRGDTVLNSRSPQALDRAAMKIPSTGFPWQEGANTYIAGHRIGWPGTESRYQFYYLPAMRKGDAIYLTDANGTTYEYRVTEKFAVKPSENWVTEPIAGRDMVTLQTCVDSVDPSTWWDITPRLMESGPDSGRLVVRADKVATYPA